MTQEQFAALRDRSTQVVDLYQFFWRPLTKPERAEQIDLCTKYLSTQNRDFFALRVLAHCKLMTPLFGEFGHDLRLTSPLDQLDAALREALDLQELRTPVPDQFHF